MKMLVTGGAGFIGCNVVKHFARKGYNITVFDNLSRETAHVNLAYMYSNNIPFTFVNGDITDKKQLEAVFKKEPFDVVIHLAAQVAVTLSVKDPEHDFYTNALGTFNVLESVRKYCPDAVFINASTNKVYGKSCDDKVIEQKRRYVYEDGIKGISENNALEFYSPYGCSKGVADQYAIDYARIYGLKTVTVRQSCIYGVHQIGIEDQGWIAWFILASMNNKEINVYGNGKQVRDVLFVSDLVDLYEKIINNISVAKGHAFNIGGGMDNAVSLLEFFDILGGIRAEALKLSFTSWRPGDQKIFISDNSKAEKLLGFKPQVSVKEGTEKLYTWLHTFVETKKKSPQQIAA